MTTTPSRPLVYVCILYHDIYSHYGPPTFSCVVPGLSALVFIASSQLTSQLYCYTLRNVIMYSTARTRDNGRCLPRSVRWGPEIHPSHEGWERGRFPNRAFELSGARDEPIIIPGPRYCIGAVKLVFCSIQIDSFSIDETTVLFDNRSVDQSLYTFDV